MGCGNSTEAVSGVSILRTLFIHSFIHSSFINIRHNLALEHQLLNKWLDLVMLESVKNLKEGSYKMLISKTEIETMMHCLMLR